jgi:hypothetical protein
MSRNERRDEEARDEGVLQHATVYETRQRHSLQFFNGLFNNSQNLHFADKLEISLSREELDSVFFQCLAVNDRGLAFALEDLECFAQKPWLHAVERCVKSSPEIRIHPFSDENS